MKHALLSLRFDRAVFFLVFACVFIAAEHLELIALHRFLTLCVFRFVNRTLPSRPPLTQSEFYDSLSSSFFSPSQTDRCTPRLPDANYFCNELHSSHTYSSALIECIISLFFRFHSFSVLSSDPVTSIYTVALPFQSHLSRGSNRAARHVIGVSREQLRLIDFIFDLRPGIDHPECASTKY